MKDIPYELYLVTDQDDTERHIVSALSGEDAASQVYIDDYFFHVYKLSAAEVYERKFVKREG